MKKNLRVLLSAFIGFTAFVFLMSCKKENETLIKPTQEVKNKSFFTRIDSSGIQRPKDIIDTVISICKIDDLSSHFSDAVIRKYGYPRWDLAMMLMNENRLKTLLVPVVDSADRVRLLISAYQQSNDKFLFKMIAKEMQQPGLPKYSKDIKVFSSQSLAGIFRSFEKKIIASKNLPHSPSSNIETNGFSSINTIQFCWTISVFYADGSLDVSNWQCITQIVLTPATYGSIASAPDLPEIGGGGGGGGGNGDGIDPNPCVNAEQQALIQLKQQFDDYVENETPQEYPVHAIQIDLKPYHEIKNWIIVKGSIVPWKVSASTVIDLSYDNFPASFDRKLSLQSLGSQYEGSNDLIISTWTPLTPIIRINNNHSRYPSGLLTESGILNHRMRANVAISWAGCNINVSPGFETTQRHTNSISITTQ